MDDVPVNKQEPGNLRTNHVPMPQAIAVATLASAITVLVGIVRYKVSAVILGPRGFGIAAEIVQLVTFVMVPLTLVTGPGFVRAISAARNDTVLRQRAYDVAGSLMLVAGLALVPLASIIAISLFSGVEAAWFSFLGAVGLLASVSIILPAQVLMIEGNTAKYAFVSAITAISIGSAVVFATIVAGLTGQFIAGAATPILLSPFWWIYYRRTMPSLRIRPSFRFDQDLVREAVVLGGTSLVSSFALQGALSAIRLILARNGGADANGYFQAAWLIGGGYFLLVQQALGAVIFPRYAAARNSAELQREVNAAAGFVFKLAPPLILIAMALRSPMTHVLYSGRFGFAANMVGFLMAADLARAVAALQAGPLLLQGKVAAFLITESLAAAMLAGLPLILVPIIGPIGAAYGYGITYMVYAILTRFVVRSACGVSVAWSRTLGAVAFGTAASLALALYGQREWFPYLLLAVAAIWIWRIAGRDSLGKVKLVLLRCAA